MIWYIVIGLNIIAVIAFFVLVFVYRRKFPGVKHYEGIRDKLTVRKKKEDNVTGLGFLRDFPIGNLMGLFIVILVGVNLIPTVAEPVIEANSQMNVTSLPSSTTMLNITLIFFVIGITVAAVSMGLRNGGLI